MARTGRGDGDHHMVGVERPGRPARGVGDAGALAVAADLADHRAEGHGRLHLLVERVGDAIHAAHGLQHGGLHFDKVLEEAGDAPELGLHHVGQAQRLGPAGGVVVAAGPVLEARPRLAVGIDVLRVEVAVAGQIAEQALLIDAGQLAIQGALVDGLGQQLREGAAGVVHRLAVGHDLALVVQLGGAVAVDHHFQRDLEVAAIAQDRVMGLGQARRPGVHVVVTAFVPVDDLVWPVVLLDHRALAHAPGAAARPVAGLKHRDLVAGLAQLVGGDQARDACAQNGDLDPLAAAGRQLWRAGVGPRRRQQPETLHGDEQSAIAASLANALEEPATRNTHFRPPLPGITFNPLHQEARRRRGAAVH